MDILHVCPSRSFSGLEQYAFELAKYQKQQGVDVGFVVCPDSQLAKECKNLNITTIDFLYDSWRGRWVFWRRILGLLNVEKNLRAIHLHMTDEVAHMSIPLFWRRLFKRQAPRPKIIFQAHIWINHNKKDVYHRLLYSNIDEVWCSSKPAENALREALPSSVKTIKIFNYGRNIQKMKKEMLAKTDARAHLKIAPDHKIIGVVSRIEEAKGIRELIEAAVPLLADEPKMEVVIIGGVSPNNPAAEIYHEGLKKDVAKLPDDLRSRIRFLGTVNDSFRYLKAFDLYVLPSHLECFSLSLLDAQLADLPVIGSDSGGTPEVVIPDQTGWLFKPRSISSLREKLKEALVQTDRWAQYGEKARMRVEKEFEQTEIFGKILKNYGMDK